MLASWCVLSLAEVKTTDTTLDTHCAQACTSLIGSYLVAIHVITCCFGWFPPDFLHCYMALLVRRF